VALRCRRWASATSEIASMADRDLILTVDKNGQRHFSEMAWINKRPTTSITAQVTP
jgi:hypothetical protein